MDEEKIEAIVDDVIENLQDDIETESLEDTLAIYEAVASAANGRAEACRDDIRRRDGA